MSWLARLRRCLAPALLCGLAAGALASPDIPGAEAIIVDFTVNGQPAGDGIVLRSEDGDYYVSESALRRWQIVHPWPTSREFNGERYYPLSGFSGVGVSFELRSMTLSVSMPAALMPMQTVDLARDTPRARIEDTGAYLDYDLNWLARGSTGERTLYGIMRPVVFGAFGNLSANLNYRNYSGGNVFDDDQAGSGLNVLELTYTRDDPARMRSLRVGDIMTRAGSHGRSIRLGGVQLATNFETRPTFIRYPLPSFYGETAVPSALDVYINGQLRRSEQVDAGRYVLEDIPAVNGAGQMQIVARDALGRQQLYSQDFYLSTELLRPGLSDYSISIGSLREAYALQNFQYGGLAGSATWRYGLRDDLTVETHGEATAGTAMLGGALQYGMSDGGTLSAGVGVSHTRPGNGARWQLGFRQQSPVLSFNVDVSGASRRFAVIGRTEANPKLQLLASAGRNLYDYGSVGVSLIRQSFYGSPSRVIASASHTKTFPNFLTLSTYVSIIRAESDDFSAGIRFSLPFGEYHSVGGGLLGSRGNVRAEAEVRRSVPVGTGYGYHLGVSASDSSFLDAGVVAQNEVGRYSLDVRSGSDTGSLWEAGTSGSVAYLSGMTSFTRQIRDAFAVVNVGGLEGVRVYRENQEIGRTNRNGQLFVPGLRPYLANQLRIELEDLPMTAHVGETRARTAPYYRSGVVVNFDVSVTTNVLFRAVLPDGRPLPEGSIARVRQTGESFPVGMDGKLYLQGIDRSSEIGVRWAGGTCTLDVPYPAGDAIIETLGDIVCEPQDAQ